MSDVIKAEVVILGSGPGVMQRRFAADLGRQVVLVERFDSIGGVCLNVGCIPSKALLHVAKVIDDAEELSSCGVDFGKPKVDIAAVKKWKDSVVTRLTGGLKMLAKQRKVQVVNGYGRFTDANHIQIDDGPSIEFDQAVIAVGSKPVSLPFIPEDPRIFDSTGALTLEHVGGHMLVLGGGIIGLEMATVYHALGSKVSVVEMADQLIPAVDADVVKPLYQRIKSRYDSIMLETRVTKVDAKKDGLYVHFEGKNAR